MASINLANFSVGYRENDAAVQLADSATLVGFDGLSNLSGWTLTASLGEAIASDRLSIFPQLLTRPALRWRVAEFYSTRCRLVSSVAVSAPSPSRFSFQVPKRTQLPSKP
ncbi:MAG: hypothetical protein HC857_10660 [Synechococcales cyanobacterium RU_4_20]|nr:hypothetical protein [Synechococcales cyanobacterium RU_4_20]NJR69153.1 hypothetical protein [Synechococcales cyanobacterium CRU_2_2]